MSHGVIRLRYGIENAGVDLFGYDGGEFKKFEFYVGKDEISNDKYQTVVVGSYEGYRDSLEFIMYHLLKVMNGEDFALYHRKGCLYTTSNVTLVTLSTCGVRVHDRHQQFDTHNDCWTFESDSIILEV